MSGARERGRRERHVSRGQALLETALVLPLLLLLAFGVVGAGRVTQARLGVGAASRESARVAVGARNVGTGRERGVETARGYGLSNGSLEILVDGGRFEPGGRVVGVVSYTVGFGDLPLLGWAQVRVRAEAWEAIDRYRSSK